MEKCFRCDRDEKEVKLVDAVYRNEIVKVCERCAITEEIPIIRRPSTSQLRDSEKAFSVYQRLKKMTKGSEPEKKPESMLDQLNRLNENPEIEAHGKSPLNLINNFHWAITRARRTKGLSQRQLGVALGESEAAIKMIEKGEFPESSAKLISKIEQFLQIKLRENTEEKKEENVPVSEIELDEIELVSSIASGKIAGEEAEEMASFNQDIKKATTSDLETMKEEKIKTQENEEKILDLTTSLNEEKRKQQLKEKIADEMKNLALGKSKQTLKIEKKSIKNEEHTPSIYELLERKRERDKQQGKSEKTTS